MTIIETSDNRLYSVRDAGDPALAHVWLGTAVKLVRGAYEPKAGARETLVRKAASRVVAQS